MDDFINFPLLGKLLVVAILTPAWLPIVKALWQEVNDSLIEEGGIFGETPDRSEAALLAEKRRRSGESLRSMSKEEHQRQRKVSPAARAQGAKARPAAGMRPTAPLHRAGRRSF